MVAMLLQQKTKKDTGNKHKDKKVPRSSSSQRALMKDADKTADKIALQVTLEKSKVERLRCVWRQARGTASFRTTGTRRRTGQTVAPSGTEDGIARKGGSRDLGAKTSGIGARGPRDK